MSDSPVLVEMRGPAAVVTLNRPQSRNAVSMAMAEALVTNMEALNADTDVRAIIVTGAGDKAFCAGADLKERATMDDATVKTFLGNLGRVLTQLESGGTPVIAAINGFALGGGLEFALACDFRLAARGASMGLTEVRLGIIPGGGGTQRLPRAIGLGKAKELIFTGRRVDADEALAIGLVNEVCEPDALVDRAVALSEMIALGSPLAVAQAKKAIHDGMQTDIVSGLAIEQDCYRTLIPTEDRIEALMAFREKRKPNFKGR